MDVDVIRETGEEYMDTLLVLQGNRALAEEAGRAEREVNHELFLIAQGLLAAEEPYDRNVYAGDDGTGGNSWRPMPVREIQVGYESEAGSCTLVLVNTAGKSALQVGDHVASVYITDKPAPRNPRRFEPGKLLFTLTADGDLSGPETDPFNVTAVLRLFEEE